MLKGAVKDQGHISPDWEIRHDLIEGVRIKEIRNVITRNGVTTEMYRADWKIGPSGIEQAIQASLRGGAVSAWHCHELQTDLVFVTHGAIKLVLFDDRMGSTSRGEVNVFHLSPLRPMLVLIPPGIWHGVQNLMPDTSVFTTFFDRAYRYDDPDEWRLPADTNEIPYRF